MRERKNSGRAAGKPPKTGKLPVTIILWTGFFILLTGLFLINRETIKKNFSVFARQLQPPATSDSVPAPEAGTEKQDPPPVVVTVRPSDTQPAVPPVSQPTAPPVVQPAPAPQKPAAPPSPAAPPASASQPVQKPAAPPSSATQPAFATQPVQKPAASPSSVSQPVQKPAAPPSPAAQPVVPAPKPVETKDRVVYFVRIDDSGAASLVKTGRKIPVSDSPMVDSIMALLNGPTAEEQRRGAMSVIPRNTRVINATVRGNTAYINFSEDFQYNTFGVEGHAAQVKQIVWTATEFPNVKDVQILINGRPVDYLGEGVWIGSPVGR